MEEIEARVRVLLLEGPPGCVQRDLPQTLDTIIGDAVAATEKVKVAATIRTVRLALSGSSGDARPVVPSTHTFAQLREDPQPQALWLGLSQPGLPASSSVMTGYPKQRVPAHIQALEVQQAEHAARLVVAKQTCATAATAAARAKAATAAAKSAADPVCARDARKCPKCVKGKGVCSRPGTDGHLPESEAHCPPCSTPGQLVACQQRGSCARQRCARHWPIADAATTDGAPCTENAASSTCAAAGVATGTAEAVRGVAGEAATDATAAPARARRAVAKAATPLVDFNQYAAGDLRVMRIVRAAHNRTDKEMQSAKPGRSAKPGSGIRAKEQVLVGTFPHVGGEANDVVGSRWIARLIAQREEHLHAKKLTQLPLAEAVTVAMAHRLQQQKPAADTTAPAVATATPHTLPPSARVSVTLQLRSLERKMERLETGKNAALDQMSQMQTGSMSRGNRPAVAGDTLQVLEATHDELEAKLLPLREKARALRVKLTARGPADPACDGATTTAPPMPDQPAAAAAPAVAAPAAAAPGAAAAPAAAAAVITAAAAPAAAAPGAAAAPAVAAAATTAAAAAAAAPAAAAAATAAPVAAAPVAAAAPAAAAAPGTSVVQQLTSRVRVGIDRLQRTKGQSLRVAPYPARP